MTLSFDTHYGIETKPVIKYNSLANRKKVAKKLYH